LPWDPSLSSPFSASFGAVKRRWVCVVVAVELVSLVGVAGRSEEREKGEGERDVQGKYIVPLVELFILAREMVRKTESG